MEQQEGTVEKPDENQRPEEKTGAANEGATKRVPEEVNETAKEAAENASQEETTPQKTEKADEPGQIKQKAKADEVQKEAKAGRLAGTKDIFALSGWLSLTSC